MFGKKVRVKKYRIVYILCFFVVFLSGCAAIYQSGFVSVPRQPISAAVTIGQDWIEIVPPKPLVPYGSSHFIELKINNFKKFDWRNDLDENTLELNDGRTVKVEAVLFDEKGQSYDLRVSQTSAGPNLVRKGNIKWSGKPNFSEADYSEITFPPDRTYTKLKIRSEIPLQCEKIEWVGWNPK